MNTMRTTAKTRLEDLDTIGPELDEAQLGNVVGGNGSEATAYYTNAPGQCGGDVGTDWDGAKVKICIAPR